MKEDKYENNLSKIQVYVNFHMGDTWRNVLHKFIVYFVWRHQVGIPSEGYQEDFLTNPLIHPSFLEITPINFTYCECDPRQLQQNL